MLRGSKEPDRDPGRAGSVWAGAKDVKVRLLASFAAAAKDEVPVGA